MRAGSLVLGLATFCGLYGLFGVRPSREHIRTRDLVRLSIFSPDEWTHYRDQQRSVYERWLRPLLLLWGSRLRLRPVSLDRHFLIQAGVDPNRLDGVELRALKLAGALGGAMAAALAATAFLYLVYLAPLAAWTGYVLPDRILRARRNARWRRIRQQLPELVGVVRAFTSAGLALERALHLIATQPAPGAHRDLTMEVRLALGRYGLGLSIEQALDEMAHRIGLDEVSGFVTAVAQGKRLGGGLEQILREQELILRLRQRDQATADAARVGTKLLGVLAGVYLPEFVILVMIPLFWGIIQQAFG